MLALLCVFKNPINGRQVIVANPPARTFDIPVDRALSFVIFCPSISRRIVAIVRCWEGMERLIRRRMRYSARAGPERKEATETESRIRFLFPFEGNPSRYSQTPAKRRIPRVTTHGSLRASASVSAGGGSWSKSLSSGRAPSFRESKLS